MVPQPNDAMPGCTYYMTLLRGGGSLQVRVGECVYVMRENPPPETERIPTESLDPTKMDIYRIERLWKNEKYAMKLILILITKCIYM